MPLLLELFCGTKSIGRVFEENGWEVVSLDSDPKTEPTYCMDILDFDPSVLQGVDLIWASPPCTEYSVAKTKGVRNLELANRIVAKTLDICRFLGCPFFMENPFGLLRKQSVVDGIPVHLIDYCKYRSVCVGEGGGFHRARKRTCIFTNTSWVPAISLCKHDCAFSVGGKHMDSAQRGGKIHSGVSHSLRELYAIPPSLPLELLEFWQQWSQ